MIEGDKICTQCNTDEDSFLCNLCNRYICIGCIDDTVFSCKECGKGVCGQHTALCWCQSDCIICVNCTDKHVLECTQCRREYTLTEFYTGEYICKDGGDDILCSTCRRDPRHRLEEISEVDVEKKLSILQESDMDLDSIIEFINNHEVEFLHDEREPFFKHFILNMNLSRDQFLWMIRHDLGRFTSNADARTISNHMNPKMVDGDLIRYTQYIYFIRDEGYMKMIPQDSWRNYDPILPMYLVSKYPSSREITCMRNTSFFLIDNWFNDKYGGATTIPYVPEMDRSVLESMKSKYDFTEEQLLRIDWNAIILSRMADKRAICIVPPRKK